MNIHLVTHLVENVKNNGPLWSHSMFGFEASNGRIVKYVKAKREILHEIVLKYVLNLTNPRLSNESKSASGIKFKNAYKKKLDLKYVELITNNGIPFQEINIFSSVTFQSVHFTSVIYTRAKKSYNYFVTLNDGSFGIAQFYFQFNSLNLLLMQLFEEKHSTDQFKKVSAKGYHICEITDLNNILLYMKFADKEFIVHPPNMFEKD